MLKWVTKLRNTYVYWFIIKDTAKEAASGRDAQGMCGGRGREHQVHHLPEPPGVHLPGGPLPPVVQEVLWSFHYAGVIG